MKKPMQTLVREQKSRAGIYRIFKNKDGSFTWAITAKNGLTTTGNRPVGNIQSCNKGAVSTMKALNSIFK